MPTIRILPDRVANQIAAGEVVERPAAVVRELVENSLDAGATRVSVEFRHGGRSFMSIEDNGRGMERDDALLSVERHATSKIAEATDLDTLHTFGFRGEALPSIASVSRFELQTRPAGTELGTEIVINGGKFIHVRECGMPQGTRIVVSNLFNSVPARRKFLKSDGTEAAHIIQCVRFYALANPEVAFTLVEDGRTIFRSPACSSLLERVTEIFGKQVAEALLHVDAKIDGQRLTGLIGKPGASRSTRHDMITFVNRRPVDTRTLSYALIESYQTALPKGRYPLAFLFLEIDPAHVDVNVHPAKREVRFRNEPAVRTFVVRALLDTLRAAAGGAGQGAPGLAGGSETGTQSALPGLPTRREFLTTPGVPSAPIGASQRPALILPPGPASTGTPTHPASTFPSAAKSVDASPLRAAPPIAPDPTWSTPGSPSGLPVPTVPNPNVAAGGESDFDAAPSASATNGWRFLGTAHGDFEIFETNAGVILLDRRAALERILFEELQAEFSAGGTASQRLLFAVPVELDPVTSTMLGEQLAFLARHGLEVSAFGRNFFRIEAVPAWLDPADAEPWLRDILGRWREGRLDPRNADLAREEMARLAAARAIRGAASGRDSGPELAARLLKCHQPLLTPAGQPTLVELSRSELARRFQKDRC